VSHDNGARADYSAGEVRTMSPSSRSTSAFDVPVPRIRATAIQAAAAAGSLLRESFGEELPVDGTPEHDVKLELDRACEQRVLAAIRRQFPRHGVLSEEMGYEPGKEPFLWIVDPLDGTVNFFHGIPIFCTCVSCHQVRPGEGSPREPRLPDGRAVGPALVGVVLSPPREELFVGTIGGGAFLNGKPLVLKPLADLAEAVIALSFGASAESVQYMGRLLPRLVERARKIRSFGSTGMDIINIAAGRTGAFVQMGTHLWDFSAPAMILREAGGIVDAVEYAPGRWRIIAGNPGIFDDVRELAER
jgi:myo-inositol-1(or 4)-monophosphatase